MGLAHTIHAHRIIKSFRGCSRLRDLNIVAAKMYAIQLGGCSALCSLDIRSDELHDITLQAPKLTAESVMNVLNGCKALKKMKLVHCDSIRRLEFEHHSLKALTTKACSVLHYVSITSTSLQFYQFARTSCAHLKLR